MTVMIALCVINFNGITIGIIVYFWCCWLL